MIILTGSTGYIGSEFARQLNARQWEWRPVPHGELQQLGSSVINRQVGLVINAAAYIPKQSVSLCDQNQEATISGNVLFPARLAQSCFELDVPIAHISTGCLWDDGKEHDDDDPPQRAFRGHCGFYVGTKVMAEQEVRKNLKHYIWRVRLPFDHLDSDRNYLSKLATFSEVWDQTNSACHRGDFVKACLDLWGRRAAFGTYNMNNPGAITASQVVERMAELGLITKRPNILAGKEDGQCSLSVAKLLATGVMIRPVQEALEDSLKNWVPRYV